MTSSEQANIGCDAASLYRLLPSLNDLLLSPAFLALLQLHSHSEVTSSTRAVLVRLKREIAEGQQTHLSLSKLLESLDLSVAEELSRRTRYSLRPVINATGVILHTNLGRAPLSPAAVKHVVEIAAGYSNLEFDLESGERSRRDVHAEELLLRLLRIRAETVEEDLMVEARGAIVVNNCAAATFLALNSLAEGAEVVVSRGELVEIGGGFRIPEILAKSGARMREVGTTNRTQTLRLRRRNLGGHQRSCSVFISPTSASRASPRSPHLANLSLSADGERCPFSMTRAPACSSRSEISGSALNRLW